MNTDILYSGVPPASGATLSFITPMDIGVKYSVELVTTAGAAIAKDKYTLSLGVSSIPDAQAYSTIITANNAAYGLGTVNSLMITEKEGFTGRSMKISVINNTIVPDNGDRMVLYLTTYYD